MSARSPLVPADLQSDCANCAALCCVLLRFDKSRDFAISKEAGTPCPNLVPDLRCGIHAELRPMGFTGCVAYDCQGAGQKVTGNTFRGVDWRTDESTAQQMLAVFPVVRQLHEILAYLVEARELSSNAESLASIIEGIDTVNDLTFLDPAQLLALELPALRRRYGPLLEQVSSAARHPRPGPDHRNADLAGAELRGAVLVRADLRGAYLMAADLRDADLRRADLLGADLRDADVRGADLTGCLFLTAGQLHSTDGDTSTRTSPGTPRPVHWARTQ